MSFFGFNVAGSALDAYQTAENVTADNIANVQTPGASRQIVLLEQQAPVTQQPGFPVNNGGAGTKGDGVVVQKITRVHQDSYDALFRGASASQNYYDVEQQQLQATQSALGEPNAGINTAYTAFQSAVQQLTSNPTGIPERNGVLSSAQNLVSVINNSGQSILSQEQQLQLQAGQVVTQINNLADQIASLNGQIRASTAAGDNPNTYLDQRDQLIDQLSGLVSTQTELQPTGSSLVTIGGKALVNDTVAYHLAPPVIGQTANGQPQLVVGFANDPNPANPVPVNIGGAGELAGYVDVYNNKLEPYKTSLDAFTSGLVTETNRITQAGYDLNGTAGGQLFQPIVAANPIGAGNIKVGIADASELPAGVASTSAGNLVVALNSANNTVDTSAAIQGNATLSNPPAAPLVGTLTVNVDGINQVLNYNTGAGGNASTIDGFINSFNTAHYGVDASFDPSSQTIVFTRDPANIDLEHRALQGANPPTPDFTITDSNGQAGFGGPPPTQAPLGTGATNLLTALGANAINGVDQNSANAFGASNAGAVNALYGLFTTAVGVPAIQTTSPTAIAAPGVATVTVPGSTITQFQVGQILTIDAQAGGAAPQENVTVTAVNYTTNQITFTAANAHAANFSITESQSQTLQNYYSSFVAKLGVDVQTAVTGNSTQTSLANNINQVRQSIDGINVDEETQNLIKFQNAYSAAAHVITTLNTMLGLDVNMGIGTTF